MEYSMKRTVQKQDLASSMKSGALDVLATPQMICWMEEAAFECFKAPEGCTTVGIDVNVQHLAASPLGAQIDIRAVLTGQEKRRLEFEVEAWCGDTCIGKGTHRRAIVNTEKFLSRL